MFRTITVAAAFCAIALAQPPASPNFEVASVKPSPPQPAGQFAMRQRGGPGSPDPSQYTVEGFPLSRIIQTAYNVRGYQVTGPSWIDTERYDIMAKIPAGTTQEQFQLMLQNLLAERFKLKIHKDSKEVPIYALVVAKGGVKMKESAPLDPSDPANNPPSGPLPVGRDGRPQLPRGGRGMMISMGPNGLHMEAARTTTAQLADVLSNQLGRPVVDETGLKAQYEYKLDFSPEGLQMMRGMPAGPPHGGDGGRGPGPGAGGEGREAGPSIFTAVQEQLGLKLDSRKGPVDLIVVDSAERTPTEN